MTPVQTIGSRVQVFHGTAKKTAGGLTKGDMMLNKQGEIVSKTNSARAKKTESPMMQMWRDSVQTVQQRPAYVGKFNKLKKGTPFYKAVMALYKQKVEDAKRFCVSFNK